MFSVLMCVYAGDRRDHFEAAFNSIWTDQTRKPEQIVLAVDGPISEDLDQAVRKFSMETPVLEIVRLPVNVGHGHARQAALVRCTEEWVVIMDADDISCPDRLETVSAAIESKPDISVFGTFLQEFTQIDGRRSLGSVREFPLHHRDILRNLPWRSPVAQPAVVFRRSAVQSVNGYQHWLNNEDYYLWVRLAEAGFRFANIDQCTVLFRVSEGTMARRGGFAYWLSEAKLQLYIYKSRVTGGLMPVFVGVCGRFLVQVLLPNSLRAAFYKSFLR